MKMRQRLWALLLLGLLGLASAQEEGQDGAWHRLFDGTSLEGWQMTGPGSFELLDDGAMVSEGGMGLFTYTEQTFGDFELELEWRVDDAEAANSGVFVRFPDVTDDPMDAVNAGYEIQIDDTDAPDHYTGSVYTFAAPSKLNSRPVGEWNQYRIRVTGQRYEIFLNGEKVNDFFGDRGLEGYIGVQNHDPGSRVYFRNIRAREVQPETVYESIGEMFADDASDKTRTLVFTGAAGERDEAALAAVEAARETMTDLSGKSEFQIDLLEDASRLTDETLANYDLLIFANTSGDIPLGEDQKEALLGFLRDGKGLVGTATAAATNYAWDDYRQWLGGGLISADVAPELTPMEVVVEEPENPAVAMLGESLATTDMLYTLDTNPRWQSRILASVDNASIGIPEGPADTSSNDYPVAWCRYAEGGRVFYTALGGAAGSWKNPAFVEHLLGGMRLAAGLSDTDCSGHRVKEVIADNIWPDDIAVDEEGNVWIAELRGKLHRYDAASGETRQIAQLATTDPTNIEHGLYGVEIDPEFYAGEPYVYLYYAEQETFINTLVKVPWRGGELVWDQERVLLRVPTEPQCCHQAGDLEWGPDGKLYISTGDTGFSEVYPDWEIGQGRIDAFLARNNLTGYNWSRLADSERTAQNLQDLRGKVLRINKDGSIPKDNPFFGEPGVRWEIFAYGLRNPYRIQADPETGCLYIGVVGPDEDVTYDEYNIACEGGENFGWPRETGKLMYNEWTAEDIPNFKRSVWEYTYETGGRSASGGPIYRFSDEAFAFPTAFQDKVFIYDWSRRWIKWADVENDRFVDIKNFDTLIDTSPISMEVGPDGSLYVAEFTGFWDPAPGALVSRYRWVEGNEAPLAAAAAEPFSGQGPLEVAFSSDDAYDPNGDALTYEWDFGDGSSSSDANPTHTYADNGTYEATLVTTDAQGEKSQPQTVTVTVGNTAPTPEITSPAAGTLVEPTVGLRLAATASDPEDGTVAGENLEWTVSELLPNGNEREITSFTGTEGELPAQGDDWNSGSQYRITLTATDSGGLAQTSERTVRLTRLLADTYDGVAGFELEPTTDETAAEGMQQAFPQAAGNYLAWDDVNLTGRPSAFVRVAPGDTGGTVELRAGGMDGTLLGSAEVSGEAEAWQTVELPLSGAEGVQDLYLVAQAQQSGTPGMRVGWLQLVGSGVPDTRAVATTSQAEETEVAAPAEAATVDLEAGREVFENNCTTCHAPDGAAVPGAYPPLTGHPSALYNAEGGRDYLANLLLYGVQGEISVEGESYNGVMPGWQQLSDQELADVLNYILSDWGNDAATEDFEPYGPADFADKRDAGLTGADIYETRPEAEDAQ